MKHTMKGKTHKECIPHCLTQKRLRQNTRGECSGAGNVWQRDKASQVIESRSFHEQMETNMSLKA